MNHLCHLFLSGDDPGVMLGNFATDMLKPSEQRLVPTSIQSGIKLHLFIDHTIDTDPVFKESIQLIRATQGKYAPVVADIFYDFLMVHHWSEFSILDYFAFKQFVYDTLKNNLDNSLPIPVKERMLRMINNDFLSSYISFDYIPHAFGFLKKRARFENHFDNALQDFNHLFPELNVQFLKVLPMMISRVKEFGINLQNSR
ncbi:MAG: ACP phosphodiesterase [Saprospiraceae bacterium]